MIDDAGIRGVRLPILFTGVALAGVLAAAIYQVLATTQRISAVQSERLYDQQALHEGVDLMARELQEVSAAGGDLTLVADQMVAFRALRSFGVTCDVQLGGTSDGAMTVTVANHGPRFRDGDELYMLVDGDPTTSEDDQWRELQVADARDGETCGEDEIDAQELILSGANLTALPGNVGRGAVLRSWEEVRYEADTTGGHVFLMREHDGHRTPLVGPLSRTGGLELRFMDVGGNRTTAVKEVVTARITLRTEGQSGGGDALAGDSLKTSVFLRN